MQSGTDCCPQPTANGLFPAGERSHISAESREMLTAVSLLLSETYRRKHLGDVSRGAAAVKNVAVPSRV